MAFVFSLLLSIAPSTINTFNAEAAPKLAEEIEFSDPDVDQENIIPLDSTDPLLVVDSEGNFNPQEIENLEPDAIESGLIEELESDPATDERKRFESDSESEFQDFGEKPLEDEFIPPIIQSIVPTENFCRPNTYFALDRIGGAARTNGIVRIREVTYNTSNFSITPQTVRIPSGNNNNINLNTFGSANSLGVTEDGIFYFTAQRRTTNGTAFNAYDVYKYELNAYSYANSTSSGVLTKVVDGGSNAPTHNTQTGEGTFVAGAVDPTTGDFYFGYYVSGTGTTGRVNLHLYRHAAGSSSSNKIGIFRTESGRHYSDNAGNGDFAFNADGDLIFIASGAQNALVGTVSRSSIDAAIANPSTTTNYTIPTSQTSVHISGVGGTAFNGIAYTSGGQLIIEAGNTNSIKRGINFNNLSGPTTLTGSSPSVTQLVDLASCHTPPVLKVQKNVESRYNDTDQFGLLAEWHEMQNSSKTTIANATTTGTATGIQAETVGPVPVESGIWYTVTETAANGANLNNYAKTLQCTYEGAPISTIPATTGSQTSFMFQYPAVSTTAGGSVVCTFTNTELRPNLVVSKNSTPVSGTTVEEDEIVTYILTFDNSTGTAAATVNHRDWMADVLDDAFFVDANGNQVSSPAVTISGITQNGSTPITQWISASNRIDINGQVGVGATGTVTFRVKVKTNTTDLNDRQDSVAPKKGYLLRNYLTPGTTNTPPATCDVSSDLCTEHPVPAWTFQKKALPVGNSSLHKGGNVHYELEATMFNASTAETIDTITFEDDLTHVFKTAGWAPDAAVPGGALPRGVYFFNSAGQSLDTNNNIISIAPGHTPVAAYGPTEIGPPTQDGSGRWTLTKTVDVPDSAMRAELWFAVQAGESPVNIPDKEIWEGPANEPASGWSFVNYASAQSNPEAIPPNQCDTNIVGEPDTSKAPFPAPANDQNFPPECQVTHTLEGNYFTIRKDASGIGQNLEPDSDYGDDPTGLWNMIGHEFVIYDNDGGQLSAEPSKYLCRAAYNPGDPSGTGNSAWNGEFSYAGNPQGYDDAVETLTAIVEWNNSRADDLPLCAIAYPRGDDAGGQKGRWRVNFLPEADHDFGHNNATTTGEYWLVETKAPTHQISLDGTKTRPVPGVQLLADPIPFKVWPISDGNLWPPVPGQNANEQSRSGRGQLDIPKTGSFGSDDVAAGSPENYNSRCLPQGNVGSRPVACVNPTGYLMVVKDTIPMQLPLAGGLGPGTYILGGAFALGMAFIAAETWRRMNRVPTSRGRYAAAPAHILARQTNREARRRKGRYGSR